MNYSVKSGHVLVKIELADYNVEKYGLAGGWACGTIVGGSEADLGVTIFFKEFVIFSQDLVLVDSTKVFVWIKPDITQENTPAS